MTSCKPYIIYVCLALSFATSCLGASISKHAMIHGESFCSAEIKYKQWFTGTVLTPTPITLPPEHPALEVAMVALNTYGFYLNDWELERTPSILSVGPFVDFMAGLTEIVGVEVLGAYSYNMCEGVSFSHFTDIRGRIGIQILTDVPNSWVPDFRIIFQETFPAGKYDNLSPIHPSVEITGEGAYQTGVHFAFQKLLEFPSHPLRLRWTAGYFLSAPFVLQGLNAYGGSTETDGKMKLGDLAVFFFSGEYSLSRRWSIAWESNFRYRKKSQFYEKKGKRTGGKFNSINTNPKSQASLALEVERTFTSNSGMLVGTWFSFAGKNMPAFAAGFISFLHIF